MFNGVPHEQFHQFIASSRTTTALPLSLPLNVSPPTFSSFIDVPHQLSHHQQVFQSHLLHQLHRQQSSNNTHHIVHDHQLHHDEEKEDQERVVDEHCGNLELADHHQGVRSVSEMVDPWEKDEVVELLRIRSSLGINNTGFSDFIWGHVSRKLAELGFKRSAEKCKEKFEEMNQLCCNNDITNYRSFSELEALFEDQNPKTSSTDEKNMVIRTDDDGGDQRMGFNLEENSGNETLENPYVENQCMVKKQHRRKRKRHHKLELLKGLCEEIVNRIMVQQEELHKKLLQDMERKEDERVAREEAWKKKEMDRINKEIEIRAQEQAIACDRETTIIEFLKKFTSSTSSNPSQTQDLELKTDQDIIKITPQNPNLPSSTLSIFLSENPNSPSRVPPQNSPKLPTSSTVATATKKPVSCTTHQNNPKIPNSSHLDLACQNPSSLTTQNNPDVTSSSSTTPLTVPQNPSSSSNDRDQENGKRWPRDEVYSLINLRCNLCSSGEDKESTKVPLWERISQGMLELGYKRSAKKCKEKWENINKYFRKTKDTNKKRSLDSKTCPYFHQLNSLYNQGRLVLPSEGPENHSGSTENHPESPETTRVSGGTFSDQAMVHANEGEKNNIIQVSPLEFEY